VQSRLEEGGSPETETIINDTKEVLLRMFEKVENETKDSKTTYAIDASIAPRSANTCRVLIGEVLSSGSTSVVGGLSSDRVPD
jgi:hypothetical protein